MATIAHGRRHRLFATALREVLQQGYGLAELRGDVLAGVTVGVIAVPLAMALAIASGVAPQYGLYTSIVAGAAIAILGGSRLSVAGPTAAFVVILHPVAAQHGLGGLLLTTMMAGFILLFLGLARMGRLIEFIPYPVTTGFTAGIAVVIATIQIKDLFALPIGELPQHFLDKVLILARALPSFHGPDLAIGVLTLATLVIWPRLKIDVPGHLIALVVGTLAAVTLSRTIDGFSVATIGTRFSYVIDGTTHQGIPALPPTPTLPWHFPGPDGAPMSISFPLVQTLVGPAFTVAMLGAIESLLCAVVADGLARTRHNPSAELVAQGVGNILAPFFGGITATGAVARTAANIRAGARSPVAAVVHAVTVLLIVLVFGTLMAAIPMASLAALLMMVAWNMSEAKHFLHVIRVAPKSDVTVLLVCFFLTVVFDMVLAVSVGVVLAALLFMQRMAGLTATDLVSEAVFSPHVACPEKVAVYRINGPLFFGAAERAMSVLHSVGSNLRVIVVDMSGVPSIDMTAIVALQSLISTLERSRIVVILNGLPQRLRQKLARAGITEAAGSLTFCDDLDTALLRTREYCGAEVSTA